MTFDLVEKAAEEPVKMEGTSVQPQGTLECPGYKSRLQYLKCSPNLDIWASPCEAGGAGSHWQEVTSINQPSSHSLG